MAPFDGGGDGQGVGPERGVAGGDLFAGRDRLPVPRAVILVPLVTRGDAVDGPFHVHRGGREIGRNADDLEAGFGVFGDDAVGHRFDADHGAGGGEHPGQRAFDRATGAFLEGDGDVGLERAVGDFKLGHFGGHLKLAIRAGLAAGQVGDAPADQFIVTAEAVAGEIVERGARHEAHVAVRDQPGTGGAEEIARVDGERGRVAGTDGAIGQRQVEVDALGQEIFDQERAADQRVGLGVRQDVERPAAGGDTGADRQGKDMAARVVVAGQLAGIFHAIGAAQDGGEGQAGDRLGQFVPRKGGGVDHLARAVGAAVGGEEDVDRGRRGAALDAAVREVEGGVGERQEGHVVGAGLGEDHRGGGAGRATGQSGGKEGVALIVGRGGAKHAVGTREQRELDAGFRLGIGQTADEDMQAVGALERGQA